MLKLLSANRIRLQKSKFFWIGLLVTIGYSVFLLIMNYIEKASYVGNSIVQINYYLLSPLSIISFFCPIFGSIFIGTEYSDGTMRNRLIVGHTRKNVYLANFMTVCLVNIFITLISSVIVILLGIGMFGWHMINPMLFLLHYLSGIMMLIAFAGFFTMVAMLIHNKTISTVISIITFLVSYMIAGVTRRLVFSFYNGESISDVFSFLSGDMVSQSALEFLYDFMPMGQCLQITSNTVFHPFRLPVYSAIFAVITVICGVLIFSKKDMK